MILVCLTTGVDTIQPPANVTVSIEGENFADYSWTHPTKEMVGTFMVHLESRDEQQLLEIQPNRTNVMLPHCPNVELLNGSVSAISICGKESFRERFQGTCMYKKLNE